MDLVNALPGVHVGQGDAYGSDDYTTVVNMRGFVIDRADQQIGITIDGIPNGGSAYAGGSKANRYLDSETTSVGRSRPRRRRHWLRLIGCAWVGR